MDPSSTFKFIGVILSEPHASELDGGFSLLIEGPTKTLIRTHIADMEESCGTHIADMEERRMVCD